MYILLLNFTDISLYYFNILIQHQNSFVLNILKHFELRFSFILKLPTGNSYRIHVLYTCCSLVTTEVQAWATYFVSSWSVFLYFIIT